LRKGISRWTDELSSSFSTPQPGAVSSSLWDTSSRSGFSVTTIHRRHADGPRKSSFSLLGGGITAWILAEFPGKILHAAAYGTSHPVLSHSYWREAWYIYDMTYVITG